MACSPKIILSHWEGMDDPCSAGKEADVDVAREGAIFDTFG